MAPAEAVFTLIPLHPRAHSEASCLYMPNKLSEQGKRITLTVSGSLSISLVGQGDPKVVQGGLCRKAPSGHRAELATHLEEKVFSNWFAQNSPLYNESGVLFFFLQPHRLNTKKGIQVLAVALSTNNN